MKSYKPLITLATGLATTVLIWVALSYIEHKNAKSEFNFEANRLHETISKRLSSYEEVLTGVKAFFMASKEVSLQEWQIYFDELQFEKYYPGLQGIAYVQRVKSDREFDELKARLQQYGMANFTIKPEGVRDEYFPVIFLDPLDEKNAKAIGYDIYSEKIRRNAIEEARKTESTSITRKITLVQEGDKNIQSGLLMMIPFFTNERINQQDTAKQLDGIIDGVIRMDDFMRALIEPAYLQNMHIRIYDQHISEEKILFDSMRDGKPESFPNRFHSSVVIGHYGQDWVITLEGEPAANFLPLFFGQQSKRLNLIILIVGCVLSGLGFYVTRAFQTTARLKKEKILDSMTKKADKDIIRRQEESLLKFREQSEYLIVCIIDIENSTKITAQLSGPQSAEFYSTFHNVISKIIVAHNGTIIKSMGDAILYDFNSSYPPSKDECIQAVNCCLDIIQSHDALNRKLAKKSLPGINCRISAVYGSVMSASKNGIHDIFGSTVNQCSKINRFAKTNGLVVSNEIHELILKEKKYRVEEVNHDLSLENGEVVYHASGVE